MSKKEIDGFCPANKTEWRKWLETNHKIKDSVWLIFLKKGSPNPNLTWNEAVDEALCFGWIDSVKRSMDSEKYMQYFSKRKKESTWSKINKKKIEVLEKNGLMTDAGLRTIETAKQNGFWTILDEVEDLKVPDDLAMELDKRKNSRVYFESLSKSEKKRLDHTCQTARNKKEENN